jgi:serine/threonine protein phosphatase PrpC
MELLTNDRVFFDTTMSSPQIGLFAGGRVAYFSQRCPGKETANEDALALLPTGEHAGILVVADGCGGMAQGELAARTAVEALQQHVDEVEEDGSQRRMSILDGMEAANLCVQALGVGAATTMAVVEIDREKIRPYHVGDSTILMVGNRGRVKLHTTAHSPVGYAVMAGVLDEREAILHEDRHLVSNVLGNADTHIEIGSQRVMNSRDTLIIGSDGLFDNLHVGEIVEAVRKGPLQECAGRLAEMATQRMSQLEDDVPCKPDDLTFVLYRPGVR